MASQNNHDQPLDNDKEKERYQIQIDRVHYKVDQDKLTGAELRALVTPPPSIPTAICLKLCPVGPIGRLKMRTLFRCETDSGSSRRPLTRRNAIRFRLIACTTPSIRTS